MDPLRLPLNSLAFFWAWKHITYNENLMPYPLISSSFTTRNLQTIESKQAKNQNCNVQYSMHLVWERWVLNVIDMYGDDLFYLKISSSYSLPTVKVKYVCCASEYAVLSKAKKAQVYHVYVQEIWIKIK